jgi:uncharacterized protein YaiI (UPF0178 family)
MKVWVDADACSNAIREIIFRVADRTRIDALMISSRLLSLPRSRYVKPHRLEGEMAIADLITDGAGAGDLVVTAQPELARQANRIGARILTPGGDLPDADAIAIQDQPWPHSGTEEQVSQQIEVQAFADQLTRLMRQPETEEPAATAPRPDA